MDDVLLIAVELLLSLIVIVLLLPVMPQWNREVIQSQQLLLVADYSSPNISQSSRLFFYCRLDYRKEGYIRLESVQINEWKQVDIIIIILENSFRL